MANEQPIKNFTAADIAAYHEGRLSSREMHALEKAALEDPFLADALDGYNTEGIHITGDLNDLSARLQERISSEEKTKVITGRFSFSWIKIAAMVVVVAGAALLIYQFGTGNKEQSAIAKKEDKAANTTSVADTAKAPVVVSSDTVKLNTEAFSDVAANGNSGIDNSGRITPADIPPAKLKTTQNQVSLENNNYIAVDSTRASVTGDIALATQQVKDKKLDAEKYEAEQKKELAAKQNENREKSLYSRSRVASAPAANANNGYVNTNNNNNYALNDSYAYKAKSGLTNNFNIFRGRVTDEANNPLPFVNITNPVDNVGTYSDAKGNFTITFPDSVLDVNVRSLGFANKNTRLFNNVADNQIIMQDDKATLNEVVVSNKKINSKRRDNNMVLEEPEPADGWSNYDRYLANNLNVPETFLTKQNSGGEVELSFEVNKQGEPINIKVEKSLCETCDKEAIRVIKEGPKWKRKAKKGRTSVTISF